MVLCGWKLVEHVKFSLYTIYCCIAANHYLKNSTIYFVFIIPGLKYALFEKLLLSNSYLLGVGGGAVVVLMWGYTGSLFITLVTVSTVVGAISLAYIMYTFIFEINFFPYVNILTTIIAIGKLLL